MKRNTCLTAFVSGLTLIACLAVPKSSAAEEVKLHDVSFQAVIDQLFGTTQNAGLLSDDKEFQLHAEGIVLTADQAHAFFVSTDTNTSDFIDLIKAAEGIRGSELKIEGLFDGEPFDLRLSGKQFKLEGISLTNAELDALIQQLQGISGLHEAKITVLVDGELVHVKLENVAGRVKIEDRDRQHSLDSSHGRDSRVNVADRVERSEKAERAERPERIERVERPELERGGLGRR